MLTMSFSFVPTVLYTIAIDSGFKALNRSQLNEHSRNADEEFETTIYGPWMEYWEITHHNRHTQALTKNQGTSLLRP